MRKNPLAFILSVFMLLSLLAAYPTLGASGADLANHALYAQYRGTGVTNGTGNYGEYGWGDYHAGKLNDGVVATGSSNTATGLNVEFSLEGYVDGTVYVYFKLAAEVQVSEVKAFANCRDNSTNRGYPSFFNVYVTNDEADLSASTLLGAASTTDTDYVREYTASGDMTGTYVVLELGITSPYIMLCLTEVEIMGVGEIPETPDVPTLAAPVLTGNIPRMETFVLPTVSWEAVEGASSYDVYMDGVLVAEDLVALSYTPVMEPRTDYGKADSYTKLQVVAKSDSEAMLDSELSQVYGFFYTPKPTDKNGNPVTSADVIIDPGHGGAQPGAVNGDRQEKDDTLNMSLKLGEYLESMGYTVAYTRITDVTDGLMNRAAKANAGDFDLFICVHRNSFSNEKAKGVETLYQTGDDTDMAFAGAVQDKLVELGLFTDRGLKARNDLVVLNNTDASIPTILVELGFISNTDDNLAFDTYFNEIAMAIAKGAMAYQGYETGYEGKISLLGNQASYKDSAAVISVTDVGGEDRVKVEGSVLCGTDTDKVEYSIDGGDWTEATLGLEHIDAPLYRRITANTFELELDATAITGGMHSVTVRGQSSWGEYFDIASINFAVDVEFTVTFVVDGVVVDSQTVGYGFSAVAPADPIKEGHSFTGWDESYSNVTSDITVTATWLANSYLVEFMADGFMVDMQIVDHGMGATAPAEPIKEGYVFAGWDTDISCITGDTVVNAIFVPAAPLGDVNGDGTADSADAAAVLQYDLGLISGVEGGDIALGDVNGDGKADSADASLILQFDLGLIEEF